MSGKEGNNFNQRNTLCISRIKIRSLTPHHEKMTVLQRSQADSCKYPLSDLTMTAEQTLVLIKPDGLGKSLTGNILTRLSETRLEIAGARIVRVTKELA